MIAVGEDAEEIAGTLIIERASRSDSPKGRDAAELAASCFVEALRSEDRWGGGRPRGKEGDHQGERGEEDEEEERAAVRRALGEALADCEVEGLDEEDEAEIVEQLERRGGILFVQGDGDGGAGASEGGVGDFCVAEMEVWDAEKKDLVYEWQDAVVREVLGGGRGYVLEFVEFGTRQEVGEGRVRWWANDDDVEGRCPMCSREMNLTKHHLIPRATHAMMKKRFGLDTKALSRTVLICRPCHSAVHRAESETSLALGE